MRSFFQQKQSFPTTSPWSSSQDMNVHLILIPIHPIASSYVQTPLVQPYIQCICPRPLRVRERSSTGIAKLGLYTSLRLQDDQQHICLFTVRRTKKGYCLTVRQHLHSWKLKKNLTCEQNRAVYIQNRPSKILFFAFASSVNLPLGTLCYFRV